MSVFFLQLVLFFTVSAPGVPRAPWERLLAGETRLHLLVDSGLILVAFGNQEPITTRPRINCNQFFFLFFFVLYVQ